MKKKLFGAMMLLAICGSVYAQRAELHVVISSCGGMKQVVGDTADALRAYDKLEALCD